MILIEAQGILQDKKGVGSVNSTALYNLYHIFCSTYITVWTEAGNSPMTFPDFSMVCFLFKEIQILLKIVAN